MFPETCGVITSSLLGSVCTVPTPLAPQGCGWGCVLRRALLPKVRSDRQQLWAKLFMTLHTGEGLSLTSCPCFLGLQRRKWTFTLFALSGLGGKT